MDFTWLITLASLIGTVANIYKRRWCFIVWLFTNSFWCVYDIRIRAYPQAALMGVYALLAVWGLSQWGVKGVSD